MSINPYLETVDGIIIGGDDDYKLNYYAFFSKKGQRLTQGRWFETDQEAIDWFKEGWPTAFKAGAEMRMYE